MLRTIQTPILIVYNFPDSDNTRKSDNILFVEHSKAMSRPKCSMKLPARFQDPNFISFMKLTCLANQRLQAH